VRQGAEVAAAADLEQLTVGASSEGALRVDERDHTIGGAVNDERADGDPLLRWLSMSADRRW